MRKEWDPVFCEKISEYQKINNVDYYKNPSHYYIEPFQIVENLYYVGDKKVCSHLLDTGDGLILFDSGYQHTIHLLLHSIWSLGFDPQKIKMIIHSHEHYDHIGAANEFKNMFECNLAISELGAKIFNERPELVFLNANPNPYAQTFSPDILIKDGDVLKLGHSTIRCISTPGHSDGVMSFFFEVEDCDYKYKVGYFGGINNKLLSKDLLFQVGRPSNVQEIYLQSLEKVINEDVDITIGNHPNQNNTIQKRHQMLANKEKNPFIDSNEWKRMINKYKIDFKELIRNEHGKLL